jgi:chromosome partitioning protein
MHRTLAVVNQKGGTGKTTTTVNLAAALASKGRRVLVVDLDPQASATAWLGSAATQPGLLECLTSDDPSDPSLLSLVKPTVIPGIDIVPSAPHLVKAERALATMLGPERQLALRLQTLPAERWDYLLFDCPPALGFLTVNALVAGPEVLVPVEASSMALAGLGTLLQTIERARLTYDLSLPLAGIVLCRADLRTRLTRSLLEHLRTEFPEDFLSTVVRASVRLQEAWAHASPIMTYAPDSTGADDYARLAGELLAQERRAA